VPGIDEGIYRAIGLLDASMGEGTIPRPARGVFEVIRGRDSAHEPLRDDPVSIDTLEGHRKLQPFASRIIALAEAWQRVRGQHQAIKRP
jgi:hypothetical protein